jgi:hypothetical protein
VHTKDTPSLKVLQKTLDILKRPCGEVLKGASKAVGDCAGLSGSLFLFAVANNVCGLKQVDIGREETMARQPWSMFSFHSKSDTSYPLGDIASSSTALLYLPTLFRLWKYGVSAVD